MITKTQSADDLILHLRYFSWLYFFYSYDETHLLIADAFFIRKIQTAKKQKMNYKTATPETYEAVITDDTKKVLVFCTENELGLVKKLQAKYPKKTITSGTYNYSCTGPRRNSTFRPFKSPQKSKAARPVFIISTPYADAEFISKTMSVNGLPVPYEYLSRATGTWLQFHKGFQISRYYNEVEQLYTKDKNLYGLLQTDVLSNLFENTSFSLARFINFLQTNNAKVILVNSTDHFSQAVMGSIMHNTPERSVWTKINNAKIQSKVDSGTISRVLSKLKQIPDDEAILETIANSNIDHLQINIEDFIANQANHIKEIANFIEKPLDSNPLTQDYEDGLKVITGLSSSEEAVRRYMIDCLGL